MSVKNDVVSRRPILLALSGLVVFSFAANAIAGADDASDRQAVLERIKPVGQVNIAGQAKPAEPAAPKAEEPAAEATPVAAAEAPATAAPAEAAAPAAPAAASGEDALALATSKGCMGCHQVAMKVVGPAYKDVAAKYKGDANAVATLAGKVKAGGVGTWGQIPMPPQPTLSDGEVNTLVTWILSQ